VNTAVAGNLDFTLNGMFWAASQSPLNADVALMKTAASALKVPVAGILNLNGTGTYEMKDGTIYMGDLAKFFVGAGMTTNVGDKPAMVNFIDIGALPLATGPTFTYTDAQKISKQFILMQHLYQIFSQLLGCTLGFPKYDGNPGMWTKHRFMGLTNAQNMYFITQVGAAAQSYGVSNADITIVATALITIFNRKNSPATAVNAYAGLTIALQSCCQGPSCTESSKESGGEPTPQAYSDAEDTSTAKSSASSYLFQPYAYLLATIVSGIFLF
jgi:hypothetical protein